MNHIDGGLRAVDTTGSLRSMLEARAMPKYRPPAGLRLMHLADLISGRSIPTNQQKRLGFEEAEAGLEIWCAGDIELAWKPCVAIVGSRKVSVDGVRRARKLARELVEAGVVVVSGLAQGVDHAAHTASIAAGGRTIAVIGTPADRVYPAAHASLQEEIYTRHLLVSQFAPGSRVWPGNFPARNKLMAALTDATVIIEAGDTSGSLHQAAECTKLNRHLFIARSVAEDTKLTWPAGFIGKYPRVHVLAETGEVLSAVLAEAG